MNTGQASPAPEAHDEVPLEGGDTGARSAGAEEKHSPPSPRARDAAGPRAEAPFFKLDAGAGTSAPRGASQDLALSVWDWSRGCRGVAFRLVRESLDGLETHLALEDAEIARRQGELAEAWAAFHAAVEVRRQSDLALQAEREEALRFSKEVREGAVRDAEEILEPLQAERQAAADDLAAARAEREAVESSLADKHRELVQLEAKILADSEFVRTSLEAVRAALDARGKG